MQELKKTRSIYVVPSLNRSNHKNVCITHDILVDFNLLCIISSQHFAVYTRKRSRKPAKKKVTVISGNECYRQLASTCVRWSDSPASSGLQCHGSQDSFHSYITVSVDSRRNISLRISKNSGEIETKRARRRSREWSATC